MKEEYWTKRDGTKVAVGEMDVDHLRNALRMVIRTARRRRLRAVRDTIEKFHFDDGGDGQDILNAEHHRALANPHAFFPLLEGGVHGSPELQKKYGR